MQERIPQNFRSGQAPNEIEKITMEDVTGDAEQMMLNTIAFWLCLIMILYLYDAQPIRQQLKIKFQFRPLF